MFEEKYVEKELIGRGKYGIVCKVHAKDNPDAIYAAKKIRLSGLNEAEKEKQMLELEILKQLKHPNIINLVDSFLNEDVLILVMEYCEKGDLMQLIQQRKKQQKAGFPEKLATQWFLQFLMALQHLHVRKIMHRDLKCQNIFISKSGALKIGDFGVSKILGNSNDKAKTLIGSPYYLSPEICANQGYDFKCDVWALGCVMYEICMLEHAFEGSKLLEIIGNIMNRTIRKPIDQVYSKEFSNLIMSMLEVDPSQRPSAQELLEHPTVIKLVQEHYAPKKSPIKSQVREQEVNNEKIVMSSNQQVQEEKQIDTRQKLEVEIKKEPRVSTNLQARQEAGKAAKEQPGKVEKKTVTLIHKNVQEQMELQLKQVREEMLNNKNKKIQKSPGQITMKQEQIQSKLTNQYQEMKIQLEEVKKEKLSPEKKKEFNQDGEVQNKIEQAHDKILNKIELFLREDQFNRSVEESRAIFDISQVENDCSNDAVSNLEPSVLHPKETILDQTVKSEYLKSNAMKLEGMQSAQEEENEVPKEEIEGILDEGNEENERIEELFELSDSEVF